MADNGSDFARSMSIATSGLRAQAGRMRVISENIANADSTGKTPEEDPYRRRIPTFEAVMDAEVGGKVVEVGRHGHVLRAVERTAHPGKQRARGVDEPLLECADDLRGRQHDEPCGDELDGQRQPVEAAADLMDGRKRLGTQHDAFRRR